MRHEETGVIYKIGEIQSVQTKSGNPFYKRELVLMRRYYDRYTGEPAGDPDYLIFEFAQKACEQLDSFKAGQTVTVSFILTGRAFTRQDTGQEDYFTSIRGLEVKPYNKAEKAQQPEANASQQAAPRQTGAPQGYTDDLPFF